MYSELTLAVSRTAPSRVPSTTPKKDPKPLVQDKRASTRPISSRLLDADLEEFVLVQKEV